MTKARGEFHVTGWDEATYAEVEAGKLTQADVTADLAGDVDGTGKVRWLMCYRADGTADYLGFLDLEATLGGRRGGFVVRTLGVFDGAKAAGPWAIVEGSGRGDLAGIRGTGELDAPLHGTATFELVYELD